MIEKKCKICNKLFKTYKSRVKIGKGFLCSRECSSKNATQQIPWNKGKKIYFSPKEHPMYGRHHSIESRKKMSQSLIGRTVWNKGIKGVMIAWNKGKKLPQFCNEKNPNWVGENVSYTGLHSWIVRYRGKPSFCEFCKTTTAKKYEWANKDHLYRRILSDYIRLCTSCHRIFDIQYNNYFKPRRK